MRTVYLIRHGKPALPPGVSAGSRICLGRMDLPLSALGVRHAEKLGRYFEERKIAQIFSSPLTRCLQTAEGLVGIANMKESSNGFSMEKLSNDADFEKSSGVIGVEKPPDGIGMEKYLSRDAKVVTGLAEIDVGEWDGLTFSEIKEKYPELYEQRKDGFTEYAPPGGETFAVALARVKPVFENILRDTDGDIVIVAHAGVNRLLICEYTGTPLEKCFDFPQPYGCINILKVGTDADASVGAENVTGAESVASADAELRNRFSAESAVSSSSQRTDSSPRISVEAVGILPGGYPDDEECALMMEEAGVPEHIIEHCKAVADYADKLARALNDKGHTLNLPLIRAAALLHDIARLSPHHAKAGAKLLRMDGYTEIADVVRVHNDISGYMTRSATGDGSLLRCGRSNSIPNSDFSVQQRTVPCCAPCCTPATPAIDEKTLLYYADKRMLEDCMVSLEKRFQTSEAKCDSSRALNANQGRYKAAKEIEALLIKEGIAI